MRRSVLWKRTLLAALTLFMFSALAMPVVAEAATTVTEKKLGKVNDYDVIYNTLYKDNYLIVRNVGEYKYGVIDLKGKEVIKCEYDDITYLDGCWIADKSNQSQTLFSIDGKSLYIHEYSDWYYMLSFNNKHLSQIIGSNEKYGLINNKGEIVAKCKYDYLYYTGDSSKDAQLFYGAADGKYDVIDATTGKKIAGGYETINNTSNPELLVVCKNGKYGLVNKTGELVKCQYSCIGDAIEYSYFKNGISRICKNGKWGYINSEGKVIVKCKYDDAHEFSDGLAAVKIGDNWGYINEKGKIVLKAIYSRAGDFSNGQARVTEEVTSGSNGTTEGSGFTVITYYNVSYVIDKKGKKIDAGHFDSIEEYHDGLAAARVYDDDFDYCYIDKKQKVVIDSVDGYVDSVPGYIVRAGNFSEGLAAVCIYDYYSGETSNSDYYYINTKGKIISKGYQRAYAFKNGFGEVQKDYKTGALNKKGKEIIPCDYGYIDTYENGLAVFYKIDYSDYSYKYGLANTSGILLECEYDLINVYPALDIVVVKKNGNYSILNNKGEAITKGEYQELTVNSDLGIVIAKKDGKYGILSAKSEAITKQIYSNFRGTVGDKLIFEKGGKLVVVNKNGKTVATMKNNYSYITAFDGNVGFGVSKGNLYKITIK